MKADKKVYFYTGYTPVDFDSNLCLKVPFWVGVSIVFLTRHLLLPLVVFATQRKTGSSDLNYLLGDIGLSQAAASILPLIVLVAWFKRNPGGGTFVRWIWRWGRPILMASAAADFVLRVLVTTSWLKTFAAAQLLLDVYIVVYLMMSRKARDVFLDFPEPSRPERAA